jgi:hypothetical protein
MLLPSPLGVAALGGNADDEQVALGELERAQGRGAWSTESTALRTRLLRVIAGTASVGISRARALLANVLPDRATEALEDFELELRVPNSAARELEERQARAGAFAALPMPPSVARLEAILALLGVDVAAINASASGGVLVRFAELAQFFDPAARRQLDLLMRWLPARSVGTPLGENDPARLGAANANASFGSTTELGRVGVAAIGSAGVGDVRPPARARSFDAPSSLLARDLNAIQEATLQDASDHVVATRTSSPAYDGFGRVMSAFIAVVPTRTILDASRDYRDRIGRVIGGVSDGDPTASSTATLNAITGQRTVRSAHWYTGTGGASYQRPLEGCLLEVNAGTGALEIVSLTATGSPHVALLVEMGPQLGVRS